jgi:hypothetical protein
MGMDDSDLLRRAELYALRKQRSILDPPLGGGTDGTVWETTRKTALKILRQPEVYAVEVECYKRFLARNVTSIHGFAVPRLIDFDNELLAIEMDVIQPPRILDFGKVTLDRAPDFSEQTMADWREQQAELWEDHWPTIQRILAALRVMGIYYSDPNPYNITPEDWNPSL